MDNTIIQQGSFTSNGQNVAINLRSDVDWMIVYNLTQAAASQTTALGVKYYWQRGMPATYAWTTFKSNAANAANLEAYASGNGFTLLDTSLQAPGALQATITAISTASIPVVTNSGTNGLLPGSVVRLINVTNGVQFGGLDFTVGLNTLTTTTFSLDYAPQISVAGTTGSFRQINFDPIFYPRRRYITNITQATQAVVTLSVTHGYAIGQEVRMVVPALNAMVEMNGLQGSIVAINTTNNTITLDINSSAFTAFVFPTSANVGAGYTPAQVVPIGENTATALSNGVDILTDATLNESFIGILLTGGASCAGGASNDQMMWVAGKSFSNLVQ